MNRLQRTWQEHAYPPMQGFIQVHMHVQRSRQGGRPRFARLRDVVLPLMHSQVADTAGFADTFATAPHFLGSRAALIEVSPAASAAQLHYVSTDEEDGAYVATRVVAAASTSPSSPTVPEASAAAASDAAASQQQSHSAPCSPKAAAQAAAAAAQVPAVPVPAPVVMAAAAVAAAAAHATTAAATTTTTTSSSEQAQQETCSTLPIPVTVPVPSASGSAATACTPAPSPTPSHNASDPARCSASVSSVAAVTQELPSSCATTSAYTATDADARSDARLSVAACSSVPFGSRDHNSVTIKANTNVKDAAGAVVKVGFGVGAGLGGLVVDGVGVGGWMRAVLGTARDQASWCLSFPGVWRLGGAAVEGGRDL